MKKTLLFLISILLFTAITLADERLDVVEYDNATYIHYYITGLDSGETFTSPAFNAVNAIWWYMQGNITNYTQRDTTINNYLHSNDIYAEIIINGTGAIDSAGLVKIEGLAGDASWVVFDTLATTKNTPKRDVITFWTAPFYKEWRFTGSIADLTASAYNVRVDITLIIPKRRA